MIRIFCSGYKPKNYKSQKDDLFLEYSDNTEFRQNITLELDSLKQHLVNKDNYAFDLILIAIYVYIADKRISRGNIHSDFDEKWNQSLEFFIPVNEPSFWKQQEVKSLLESMFQFAVGHSFKFNFVKDKNRIRQLFLDDVLETNNHDFDCISMFSGALDSLSSSLELILNKQRNHC